MIVRSRRGLPNVAAKLARDEPVHIVAYGSSMTDRGYYLELLVDRVSTAFNARHVTLTRLGMDGAGSMHAVHCLERRLFALAPNLVLLEFAINDDFFTPDTLGPIVHGAMHALVTRIRARYPACDLALVHFQHPPGAPGAANLAVAAYESLADSYGIPSIDLARLSSDLVASGVATWNDGPRALLCDGLHHAPLAADLIGTPFADALIEAIAAPGSPLADRTAAENAFDRAQSMAVRPLTGSDTRWTHGPLDGDLAHLARSAMVTGDVATALAPGATFTIGFPCSGIVLSVLSRGGRLALRSSGAEATIEIPIEAHPRFLQVRVPPMPDSKAQLDVVALTAPIVLGDIYYFGDRIA